MLVFMTNLKDNSYTGVADVVFVASWSKAAFVEIGKVSRDTTTISVATCFHLQIQGQHQQHTEHHKDYHSHGQDLLGEKKVLSSLFWLIINVVLLKCRRSFQRYPFELL